MASIRLATLDEIVHLPALERVACGRFDPFGYAELQAIVTPVDELRAGVLAGSLFVAVEGDAIVGFALASLFDGGLHLDELDVLPSHGRRGIGRALVGAVVDLARARGLARVTLSTLASIPWNAPWYATLGFRALTVASLTPALCELREAERSRGLPMADRVYLRKDI